MNATTALIQSLDLVVHEATGMISVIDEAAPSLPAPADCREAKRRVLLIRDEAQRLLDWLAEARLEDPRH